MRTLFAITVLITTPAFSGPKHQHGAHVHGAGTVAVAFDKEKGQIDFEAPADGVVGFEHAAKSDKDKKRQEDALKKFEEKIGEMVAFDSALGCKFTKDELKLEQNGKHAELKASFSVTCAKAVAGSKIVFDFRKSFPGLKNVDVVILVDGIQKELEIAKSGVSVDLK